MVEWDRSGIDELSEIFVWRRLTLRWDLESRWVYGVNIRVTFSPGGDNSVLKAPEHLRVFYNKTEHKRTHCFHSDSGDAAKRKVSQNYQDPVSIFFFLSKGVGSRERDGTQPDNATVVLCQASKVAVVS